MIEIDTSYFIGNAPGEVRVSWPTPSARLDWTPTAAWWDVVPKTPVLVDTRHRFLVAERRPATHLRLDVYPDGGLTRLRCFGEIPDAVRATVQDRLLRACPRSTGTSSATDPATAPFFTAIHASCGFRCRKSAVRGRDSEKRMPAGGRHPLPVLSDQVS